jgi:hypothetical protein
MSLDQVLTELPENTNPDGTDLLLIVDDPTGTPDTQKITVVTFRETDPNRPTEDEKAALAGTSGAPSATNKYVTASDPTLPTTDEKAALAGTSGTPSATNKYVTNSDSRNSDARTPTAHATTHAAAGSDPVSLSWTQVAKTGSSLADLGTRSASDLTSGTLAAARGGTGAGALTAGSVPFVTASGVFAEDNAKLSWDNTNKRLAFPILANSAQTSTSTGGVNAFAATSTFVRLNNAADLTINGIAAGVDGQIVTFRSIGAGNVYFAHNSGSAASGDKLTNFLTSGLTPLAAGKGSATFRYSSASSTWVLIEHNQGGFISITFSAGDFTANGSMTWTVASGDVPTDLYMVVGRALVLVFRYHTTTVGGTPNTSLLKTIPGGYATSSGWDAVVFSTDNGTGGAARAFDGSSTQIAFSLLAGGNWAASTDNTKVSGFLGLPIT